MNSNLVIKFKLGEETRRITLKENPTFSQLEELLSQIFPSFSTGFVVKYLDDDEDLVTVSTDIELHEALNLPTTQNSKVLRLSIFPKVPQQLPTPQVPSNSIPSTPSPSPSSSSQPTSTQSIPQFP